MGSQIRASVDLGGAKRGLGCGTLHEPRTMIRQALVGDLVLHYPADKACRYTKDRQRQARACATRRRAGHLALSAPSQLKLLVSFVAVGTAWTIRAATKLRTGSVDAMGPSLPWARLRSSSITTPYHTRTLVLRQIPLCCMNRLLPRCLPHPPAGPLHLDRAPGVADQVPAEERINATAAAVTAAAGNGKMAAPPPAAKLGRSVFADPNLE